MKNMDEVSPCRFPKISSVGETALLIELGDALSPEVNAQVHALDSKLMENPLAGVREWVPAFASLLLIFDPLIIESYKVRAWVQKNLDSEGSAARHPSKRIIIPVYYGGNYGPDLAFVANYHHLSPEEVVRRHKAPIYKVGMMGFTPGFAYLLGLDPGLSTPRLSSPRTQVPAGSVGLAGGQTGIYPLESPGGWQLIGRTEVALFNPNAAPHFLLSPGDEVQFTAVKVGE